MRILYSHRTRSSDGQFVHIRALTEALAALGHDVLIHGPDGTCAPDELEHHSLDAGRGGRKGLAAALPGFAYEMAEYAYSWPAARRLKKVADEFQPDILYERANLFYDAGKMLHRQLGLPTLLEVNAPLVEERSEHGGLALKGLAARQEKSLWRSADHVLPVSSPLAERIKTAGVAEDKITIIPNGVTATQLQPGNATEIRTRYNLREKLIIGFTGFVRDWHGADMVIRWLPKRPEAVFLLVGDGPAIENLRRLADDLGVRDRVIFTGVVQREDLSDHVAAFDIAVQPRVTDYASPLKLFDYMAQSRAIIAPDQNNIRDVLTANTDAVLFEPDSENAFHKSLNTLADMPPLRTKLGNAARATLDARDFTWKANAERVTAIAEKLLAR